MKTWGLVHSLEGTSVDLTEVPFWAWAAETAGDEICWLGEKVLRFCLIAPPEWTFRVRWGRRDEDGYTSKCAGSKLYGFGNALMGGFGAYRRAKTIARLPVSYEWVREHQPDAGGPWDGSWDDDGDQGLPDSG